MNDIAAPPAGHAPEQQPRVQALKAEPLLLTCPGPPPLPHPRRLPLSRPQHLQPRHRRPYRRCIYICDVSRHTKGALADQLLMHAHTRSSTSGAEARTCVAFAYGGGCLPAASRGGPGHGHAACIHALPVPPVTLAAATRANVTCGLALQLAASHPALLLQRSLGSLSPAPSSCWSRNPHPPDHLPNRPSRSGF